MFNGPLEVGTEYELNNGKVWECVLGTTPNPVLNGVMYLNDGSVWHSGPDHPLSVRGPAVGTIEELELRPGDVISSVNTGSVEWTIECGAMAKTQCGVYLATEYWPGGSVSNWRGFRIISRAKNAAQSPILFRDMATADQGAILLADFNGREIQKHLHGDVWGLKAKDEKFYSDIAYQIKPAPKKRTVDLYFDEASCRLVASKTGSTKTIRLVVMDGELVDAVLV